MSLIDDIMIGSSISFQSKAVNDNNFYYGKVIGQVTHDLATTYADIYTYNSSVQSADQNVPEVNTQEFFILRLIEPVDNSTRYVIPFSKDWINLPTLTIHSKENIAVIRVYEVDNTNVQDVINLLKTSGFKAKVDSLL